jgi:molecular chaperone GrpE
MTKHKAKPKDATTSAASPPATPTVPARDTAAAASDPLQAETPLVEGGALVEAADAAVRRLTEQVEQLNDRYLRLAAEFDNFKKRTQRERSETWNRAQAEVVAGVLDTLDDLGRVAHLDPDATPARDLLAGFELVERKLLRELSAAGLERVGSPGEPFDPNTHEAVASLPAPDVEQDHRVAMVMQPGYRFSGALLRPARVSVYVWQEPADEDAEPPAS